MVPRRHKSRESRGRMDGGGVRATTGDQQREITHSAGGRGRRAHTGRPGLDLPNGNQGERRGTHKWRMSGMVRAAVAGTKGTVG